MNRVIKGIIISVIAIILGVLMYLLINSNTLGLSSDIKGIDLSKKEEYDQNPNLYYYTQLTDEQKDMYYLIDIKTRELKEGISLGICKRGSNAQEDLSRALTAFTNDHPECFTFGDTYELKQINLYFFTVPSIRFTYQITDLAVLKQQQEQLDNAVNELIASVIKPNMTDFEKELAIHDKLIEQITYYNYDEIENIPEVKHTAYGALVQNEAVCDGVTKAFQLVMNRIGFPTILVSGEVDGTPHAWNISKIGEEYYHIDVTLNSLKQGAMKYATHIYFNLTDEEIERTHLKSEEFELPKCVTDKYNYYRYTGRYTGTADNLTVMINVALSRSNDVLELMIQNKSDVQEVVNVLYKLDFNGYKSRGERVIKYSNIDNIYIFTK